jgi:lysostaphin
LAKLSHFKKGDIQFNSFFKDNANQGDISLFFDQNKTLALETPDLKIIEDNFIYGISTPRVLTTQTLGDIFGGTSKREEIIDYYAETGENLDSIAKKFGVSTNALLWSNPSLTKYASLKVGQHLLIPPGEGVVYLVKQGDTVDGIAQKYKTTVEKIVEFNKLKNEFDIFVDEVVWLPGAQMPKQAPPIIVQKSVPNTFFIYPTQGRVSQWRHGFAGRAIDVANKCGTPVYAAASGLVQRAQFNSRYGNFVTVAHSNGTSAYYGHLQSMMVKPGDLITTGHMIGLMGRSGTASTGCHLHFEIRGTDNFLAAFNLGGEIKFK